MFIPQGQDDMHRLTIHPYLRATQANIKELVPEAEGMNILRERMDGPVERVMSNSFGFGGTNACLIFDKYTE